VWQIDIEIIYFSKSRTLVTTPSFTHLVKYTMPFQSAQQYPVLEYSYIHLEFEFLIVMSDVYI